MAQRQLQSFLREHNDANAEHDEANAGITLGGLGSCSDSSQPTDVRNPKRVSRSRSPAAVRLRALTVLRREMGVPISEKIYEQCLNARADELKKKLATSSLCGSRQQRDRTADQAIASGSSVPASISQRMQLHKTDSFLDAISCIAGAFDSDEDLD